MMDPARPTAFPNLSDAQRAELRQIMETSFALGVGAAAKPRECKLPLRSGHVFIAFTDGLAVEDIDDLQDYIAILLRGLRAEALAKPAGDAAQADQSPTPSIQSNTGGE